MAFAHLHLHTEYCACCSSQPLHFVQHGCLHIQDQQEGDAVGYGLGDLHAQQPPEQRQRQDQRQENQPLPGQGGDGGLHGVGGGLHHHIGDHDDAEGGQGDALQAECQLPDAGPFCPESSL